MDITIREMQPKEALSVWKLGIVTFHSMEGLFMGKPKTAMVAVDGDKVVGGVTYKTYRYEGGLLGYVDYAFVDHNYHGQGIGSKLYEATVLRLKELGCTQVFGLVRGDNPASFTLFEKQNMQRSSLGEIKRLIGVSGLLKIMLVTPFSWGPAADCYLSNAKKKQDNAWQILLFLLVNLGILLFGIPCYGERILYILPAAATVMAISVLLGASVCLFQKDTYHFRLSTCGAFISAIVAFIGGIFFMNGKWYPKQFEASKKQRLALAVSSSIEWIGMLALYIVCRLLLPDNEYVRFLAKFSYVLIFYRLLPTYPFSEYGGRRVYEYNKWIYVALWLISAFVLGHIGRTM